MIPAIKDLHKNRYLGRLLCKLGRHDYEFVTAHNDKNSETGILECFYCKHGKQSTNSKFLSDEISGKAIGAGVEGAGFIHGPFVIVVTDPANKKDTAFPMVIAPSGGYESAEEAISYVEKNFANRKNPYLGFKFKIAQLNTENDFGKFCSWED